MEHDTRTMLRALLLVIGALALTACGGHADSSLNQPANQPASGLTLFSDLDPTALPTVTRFMITVRSGDGSLVDGAQIEARSRQHFGRSSYQHAFARPIGKGVYALDLHLDAGSGWEVNVHGRRGIQQGDLSLQEDVD